MTHDDIDFPQGIFRRKDFPPGFCDYLMSFREGLTADFMRGFDTLEAAALAQGKLCLDRTEFGHELDHEHSEISHVRDDYTLKPTLNNWKIIPFRYVSENHEYNYIGNWIFEEDGELPVKYPTACNLTREFRDHCKLAKYSLFFPRTVLTRHTGPENRNSSAIRIHIPLIIPKGEIFLEVNGEEVDWSDIFAFNNQLAHSSHNYSYEYRLVFIIDIERSFIGLPPAPEYKPEFEIYARPYTRRQVYRNDED